MYLAMGVIATTLIVNQARVMLMLDRETQRAIDIAQRVVAPAIRADDEAGAATPHHLRRSIEQLHFVGTVSCRRQQHQLAAISAPPGSQSSPEHPSQ